MTTYLDENISTANMSSPIPVNIAVALSAEAHPVIGYYKLRRDHSINSFEVYRGESVNLIVSGIGKLNMANAVGFLAGQLEKNVEYAWLNVGIAGGNIGNLGDTVLANCIFDQELKTSYYPSINFNTELAQAKIITVNRPADVYVSNCLLDMEASGFYVAASRYSTSEIVQCCKIVSDNSQQSAESVNKEKVINLIQARLPSIDLVLQNVGNFSQKILPNMNVELVFDNIVSRLHFTESQKNQLRICLKNWLAVYKNYDSLNKDLSGSRNAKELLSRINSLLANAPVVY